MTAKEFLSQAYRLDRKADMILRKADAMRKSLYGRGNSGENHGGNASDSIGKAIARVVAYEEQADRIIEELIRKWLEQDGVKKDTFDEDKYAFVINNF